MATMATKSTTLLLLLCLISLNNSKNINFFEELTNRIMARLSKNGSDGSPFRRGLLDSSCADGSTNYNPCSSSDPSGCPCTAFTKGEKELILDTHNARRDLAASGNEDCYGKKCPLASDMNYLFWDPGLEAVATYWAHTCPGGHHGGDSVKAMYLTQCNKNPSNCKAENYASEWVGENMAWRSSGSVSGMETSINSWFDESVDYEWDSKTSHSTTGHWTQGVWARTRYVGCGYSSCTSGWGFTFVCNYYPGGNFGSGWPYEEGTPCDKCEADRIGCISSPTTSHDALCGGPQCSTCAQQVSSSWPSQQACDLTPTTCTGTTICKDGVEGPAMSPSDRIMPTCSPVQPVPTQAPNPSPTATPTLPQPTASPVPVPTASPTVAQPTAAPTAPTTPSPLCAVTLSDLGLIWGSADVNGEYSYRGDHNGVPYYRRTDDAYYMYSYSGYADRYIIDPDGLDAGNTWSYCNNNAETDVTNCIANDWSYYDGSSYVADSNAAVTGCGSGPQPTAPPTPQPTYNPTNQPTNQPTSQPTNNPTDNPTNNPTDNPTNNPTSQPTPVPITPGNPTTSPSNPTNYPTDNPTSQPTSQPSSQPTNQPTTQPSRNPTDQPTLQPTNQPTSQPSGNPTDQPTNQPTKQPLVPGSPTQSPTEPTTQSPTPQPTNQPTTQPTNQPSDQPTNQPTLQPTNPPTTSKPTESPVTPGVDPTKSPSESTDPPTKLPTELPSTIPSSTPTSSPIDGATLEPTTSPTDRPIATGTPTTSPTREYDHCYYDSSNWKKCKYKLRIILKVLYEWLEAIFVDSNDVKDSFNTHCMDEWVNDDTILSDNIDINIAIESYDGPIGINANAAGDDGEMSTNQVIVTIWIATDSEDESNNIISSQSKNYTGMYTRIENEILSVYNGSLFHIIDATSVATPDLISVNDETTQTPIQSTNSREEGGGSAVVDDTGFSTTDYLLLVLIILIVIALCVILIWCLVKKRKKNQNTIAIKKHTNSVINEQAFRQSMQKVADAKVPRVGMSIINQTYQTTAIVATAGEDIDDVDVDIDGVNVANYQQQKQQNIALEESLEMDDQQPLPPTVPDDVTTVPIVPDEQIGLVNDGNNAAGDTGVIPKDDNGDDYDYQYDDNDKNAVVVGDDGYEYYYE